MPERNKYQSYGPICRHCHKKKPTRPRGLCWPCYYTPGVRELYPITAVKAPMVYKCPDVFDSLQIDATATDAAPGTPEKIAVMEDRVERGVSLFHPADRLSRPDPVKNHDEEPVELQDSDKDWCGGAVRKRSAGGVRIVRVCTVHGGAES